MKVREINQVLIFKRIVEIFDFKDQLGITNYLIDPAATGILY